MSKLVVAAATLALGLCLPAMSVSGAANLSPIGNWQVSTGESRYKVVFCGDGTDLCAKLTWLHPSVRTSENLAYLNKLVLSHAAPVGDHIWAGAVDLYGEKANGKIRQTAQDTLVLTGCQLIMCKTVTFNRI